MKKLSILFACLAAVFTFHSCEDDKDPVYQAPTEFIINTPALANQYYELTPTGTIDMTWSQPNYGYAAAATYQVMVSLNENAPDSAFIELGTEYKTCNVQVKESEIAEAICALRGIADPDSYTDTVAHAVYFRVHAYIKGIEGSDIYSQNTIKLEQVKGYSAIKAPGFIYLIGAPGGWTGPDAGNAEALANWRLFESTNAIGSKIYSGVFDIPAGSAMFRFYTALTGWDADSYGSQVDDNPIDYELTDGVFNGTFVKGKGSFNFPNWEGGSMKITVNFNNNTVIIEEGGVDTNGKNFIYIVGPISGWTEPAEANSAHYEPYKLYDLGDNGVYTGTFELTADQGMFRFYKALSGWDGGDSYGSQVEDAAIDVALVDGVYSGAAVAGKGSWNIAGWAGGKLDISVDTNTNTVTFTQK